MAGLISLTPVSPFDLFDKSQLYRDVSKPDTPTAKLAAAKDITKE